MKKKQEDEPIVEAEAVKIEIPKKEKKTKTPKVEEADKKEKKTRMKKEEDVTILIPVYNAKKSIFQRNSR